MMCNLWVAVLPGILELCRWRGSFEDDAMTTIQLVITIIILAMIAAAASA
jgi:hypothetical protein